MNNKTKNKNKKNMKKHNKNKRASKTYQRKDLKKWALEEKRWKTSEFARKMAFLGIWSQTKHNKQEQNKNNQNKKQVLGEQHQ